MLDVIEHGPIRELRLARPPANAFTQPLVMALTQHLRQAVHDECRAIVISGQPGMFSGGLDVPSLITLDWNELKRFMRALLGLQLQLAVQPIPVIAAITGHCVAAGCMVAMFCDHRIMAQGDYHIGLNEVAVGLPPGRIAYQAFRRLVGARLADHLVVRGEFIGPERALSIGLVDRLTRVDDVVASALADAASYVALPPGALMDTRRAAREDLVKMVEAGMRDDSEELHQRWFSAEAQQGLRALAEKLSKA